MLSKQSLTTTQKISHTDTDWAGDPDKHKSVSEYCIFIRNNTVIWSSKKQNIVAKSSTNIILGHGSMY